MWPSPEMFIFPTDVRSAKYSDERVCMSVCLYARLLTYLNKNSSGDEIANVNFLSNITHVETSAYAHWTDFLISTINIYARPNLYT